LGARHQAVVETERGRRGMRSGMRPCPWRRDVVRDRDVRELIPVTSADPL
jgi:hypothetical protein